VTFGSAPGGLRVGDPSGPKAHPDNAVFKYKYKYNSYFYCAPYSLTDGALQKSASTCFTAV